MGDTCYMRITCRRQDRERFEKLGFCLEREESAVSPVIVMLDTAAGCAHKDKLPRDVPYRGYHSAETEYGAGAFACDGKEYAEVEQGHHGGFIMEWDEVKGEATLQSTRAVRAYLKLYGAVEVMFSTLTNPDSDNA